MTAGARPAAAGRGRNWWRLPVAVAVMTLVVINGPSPSARALDRQTGPGPPPSVAGNELRLTDQTSWVGDGQAFKIGVAVTTPDPAVVRLQVTVFDALLNRTDFTASLTDRIRTPRLKVFDPVTLASLGRPPSLSIAINPAAAARTVSSLRLSTAGVYPVRVDLVDGRANLLDRLDTHLVYVGDQATTVTRLDVGWIVPVHASPVVAGEGAAGEGPTTSTGPQPAAAGVPADEAQRLADLVGALTANPHVPVTLAPNPRTIEALANGSAAERATVSQLAELLASSGDQAVSQPYAPIDLPALLAAGLESEITAQVTEGLAILGANLHVTPPPNTWVENGPLSPGVVDDLAGRGVRQLVVPDATVTMLPADQRKNTPAQPFAMAAKGGRQIRAVAADSALAGHFNSQPDQVLAAHQLLADLAVIQEELPQARGGRGVAIIPPDDWRPDAGFVATVLDGIATSPMLSAVTLDRLFAVVSAMKQGPSTLVRGVATDQPARRSPLDVAATKAALRPLASLATAMPAGGPLLDEIKRDLLVSESRDIDGTTRSAVLADVGRSIDQLKSLVRLPGNRSITFTAHQGVIPVTILSSSAVPMRISLRVSSQKLGFRQAAVPGGSCSRSGTAEVCTLDLRNQNTTLKIPVTAKTAGVFSLSVVLQSPDGGLVFATDVDTVRSTAASSVGVILSIGAVLLLGVWWARDLRHGRRARRLVPTPGSDGHAGSGLAVGGPGRIFDLEPVVTPPRWEPPPGPWTGPELADDWGLPEFGLDESCFAVGVDSGPDGAAAIDAGVAVGSSSRRSATLDPVARSSPLDGAPSVTDRMSRSSPSPLPYPDRSAVALDDPTGPLAVIQGGRLAGSGPPPTVGQGAGPAGLSGSFSRRTAVMASGTLLSRITGFGRVLALVWAFRLTGLADVYNIANTVPNILYDLVLGGVLSATLVPVFVDYLNRDDPDEGWRAISAVVTAITVVLVVLSAVFWLLTPAIIRFYLVLNNTSGAPDQRAIGTTLLRLFVPQLFLLGGIAVTTALLNARRNFAVPAFSPVLNNLAVIAAILATRLVASSLTLSQFRHQQVALLILGLGTTSGYLLQFLVQLPALVRSGFRFRPVWDLSHPAVRTVLRLSLWTFGSVLANQVAFNLVLVLADKKPGDVTVFQTAYQFFQLPYAIFAVSIASVITPDLSERWARHDLAGFRRQLAQGLRLTLAILVPAAVGYVVLAQPFLQLVFRHGSFSAHDAHRIGTVVALFAIGLPGFSGYLLLMRGYQAMQDTRSMFWLYLVENMATLVLAGALYPRLGVQGLALGWVGAYSIGSIAAFVHLRRRTEGLEGVATAHGLVRVGLATGIMAVAVIAVTNVIRGGSDVLVAGQVGAGVVVGTAVYLAASRALGISEVTSLLRRSR